MSGEKLVHHWFPVGPLQCNCSILGDSVSRKAVVVDPGGDAGRILKTLEEENLILQGIIHTHAHLDHILAAGEIREATGAPIFLHRDDIFLWDMVQEQCRMFGIPEVSLPPPDRWLQDDEDLHCCSGVALHTPGTPLAL